MLQGPRATIREPWTLELSKQSIGRAGEFQAAAIFERHGIVTTHVDIYGVDLWCQTPSGRRVSVQVKATQKPTASGQHTTPRYAFQLRLREDNLADVYCLIALDQSLFRLFSASELTRTTTKKISALQFTEDAMLTDIKRYLY